jgi:hypothetical protein
MTSESTALLAAALLGAQAQIKGAVKDARNPHFKASYADLSSVWDACREALIVNGLTVAQYTDGALLVTRLMHISGEWIEGRTPLLMGKSDMQALGSAITYARRYGLAAMVGVCPEDDDGNAAVQRDERKAEAKADAVAPAGFDEWRLDFEAAADNGGKVLGEAWKRAKPEYRTHYNSLVTEAQRETLRARAAKADAAVPA